MLCKSFVSFISIPNISLFQQKNSVKVNYSTPRRKRKAFSLISRFKDIKTLRLKASGFYSMNVLS